jgi:hypothetical protein
MTSVSAASASTTTPSTTSTTSKTPATDASKPSFATLFTEAEDKLKKGEKLSKVDGHEFGRIKGGTRDGMCVNLSGNARNGQAFDLITRDGHQFHVYGTGKDRKVFEVGGTKSAADTTPASTPSTDTTSGTTAGTTTTDTTSGGTSGTTAK